MDWREGGKKKKKKKRGREIRKRCIPIYIDRPTSEILEAKPSLTMEISSFNDLKLTLP